MAPILCILVVANFPGAGASACGKALPRVAVAAPQLQIRAIRRDGYAPRVFATVVTVPSAALWYSQVDPAAAGTAEAAASAAEDATFTSGMLTPRAGMSATEQVSCAGLPPGDTARHRTTSGVAGSAPSLPVVIVPCRAVPCRAVRCPTLVPAQHTVVTQCVAGLRSGDDRHALAGVVNLRRLLSIGEQHPSRVPCAGCLRRERRTTCPLPHPPNP